MNWGTPLERVVNMLSKIFSRKNQKPANGFNRRDLFRQGGLLTIAGSLPAYAESTRATSPQNAAELYQSIGVRPVINAKGTFTIISGSQTLPEVKKAMDEASRNYVQMDEL